MAISTYSKTKATCMIMCMAVRLTRYPCNMVACMAVPDVATLAHSVWLLIVMCAVHGGGDQTMLECMVSAHGVRVLLSCPYAASRERADAGLCAIPCYLMVAISCAVEEAPLLCRQANRELHLCLHHATTIRAKSAQHVSVYGVLAWAGG